MVDKTLPNGKIISNLPDNISDADVKRIALLNNLATEEDYNRDVDTDADALGFIGELGGGVGGAIKGASMGAAFGPVGAFVGGVAGGAIGTFIGKGLGETLEAFGEELLQNLLIQLEQMQLLV
jgi:phage tail tape-measure protein